MELYHFLTILLALVASIGLWYFKSYAKEQAKNDVLMKDIAKMTGIVETVKNDLMYRNQVRTSIYQDKRQAIINTYEAISLWFHKADHALMNSISFKYNQPLKSIAENDESYYQVIVTEAKMELYVKEEELSQLAMDIKSKIHDFLRIVEIYFVTLNRSIRAVDNALPESGEPDPVRREAILANAESLNEEKGEIYSNAVDETQGIKIEIRGLISQYRDVCFKIISEEYSKENLDG